MAILPLNLARVSNNLRTSVAVQQLTRTESDLLTTQNQLSTGKKLNAPSDDPGASATAMQLQKTLEQRTAYSANLKAANSQLSEVDSSLGDLTDLMRQAQTIASANVGSDVTPDARKAASAVVDSLYNQALTIANKQYNGAYLFGGDKSTAAPFVETNGGVQFVGSSQLLSNAVDDNAKLSFQANGDDIFGAVSSRVKGVVALSPVATANTRLSDVQGATGEGIHLGSIALSDGSTTKNIDLTGADTVGDIVNTINAAGVGTVTAAISSNGKSFTISSSTATDNVSVNEVGGGKTAESLGILSDLGAGAGNPINGTSIVPRVTPLTPLTSLNNGAGIDLTGLKVTNGSNTVDIDFTGVTDVEGLINKINNSGADVRAQINAAGTGIDLMNPTQGTSMSIGENGGTTAADLGIRSFSATSPLSELNNGKGVRFAAGNDIELADSNGVTFQVDLDGSTTIQDVLGKINAGATTASAGITASFATSGNGIVLTDTASGSNPPIVKAINFSNAALDLGLSKAIATNGVISGADVNQVTADGLFANLKALRDSLDGNDQAGITAAAEGIDTDTQRLTTIRGETGARVQELESRSSRLDDQNTATTSLLSSVQDTDFTTAITKFQSLQTALEANLQTTSKILNLSLMDFLS